MSDKLYDARPRQIYIYEDMIKRHGKKLGVNAIAVYCVLAVSANDKGDVVDTAIGSICSMLDLSRNTVKAALTALEDSKWIRIYRHKNSAHHYYLMAYEAVIRGSKSDHRGSAPLLPGVSPTTTRSQILTPLVVVSSSSKKSPSVTEYEKWGFTTNPAVGERLFELDDTYKAEWIKEAFGIATSQGKLQIAYVEGILKRWAATGKDAPKPAKNGKKPEPIDYYKGYKRNVVRS